MVDICRSARGIGGGRGSEGGLRSLAMVRNSRQQASVVALVIRPMRPKTVLICLLVQRAISGCREAMAGRSLTIGEP